MRFGRLVPMPSGFSHYLLAGLLFLFVAIVASNFWTPSQPTIDDLREEALHGQSSEDRARAAIELSKRGPEAVDALRYVLEESSEVDVRAVSVAGLAHSWDYPSMERFLELAATADPKVASRAAQAIMQMTGRQRRFSTQGLAEMRQQVVQHMRDDWMEISAASPEDRDALIERLKANHENN